MEALSVRDYRNNLSNCFDLARQGKDVFIHRNNQMFALVYIENPSMYNTPALQKRAAEVYRDYEDGKCVTCNNLDELNQLFDSL